MSLSNDLEHTIDLSSRDDAVEHADDVTGETVFALPSQSTSSSLSKRFNESTRQLLRVRLMMAAGSTLGFLIAIKTAALLYGDATVIDFLTRLTASVVLACSLVYLYFRPEITLRRLRVIEAVIGIALSVECVWVLISETQKRIENGELETAGSMFVAICFAFAIFIAIYGMFIPNNWRKTGSIAFLSALVPLVSALILRQWFPELQTVRDFPGFAAPTMTVAMAVVATIATYVVHQIRREAETAKHYGQYQLLEEIGQGGMGVVYKAKHRMLKRPAAIKLIRSEVAGDPKMISEFEHEVQLSAKLTHWNSVQIYDYGRTDHGDFYYVMEHLEGETLLDRIRKQGKLSNIETVKIVSQICDGLQEAHLKGMVHRDIKPANVFLSTNTGQEVVKILDFGLAATKAETDRLQKVSGSPAYMSPEQFKSEIIDERSDIYALGCVIFECLSGQRLFVGESINDVMVSHLHETPKLERLLDSAAQFKEVIEMCVAKNAESRFSNVTALKNALLQHSV